jgi:uncharacterized membrane protein (UPF0127 family)
LYGRSGRDDARHGVPAIGALEFARSDGRPERIRAWRARGFIARLRGLIAQPLPAPATGLWIEPCVSVHTFGVREPLDLVFVSRCMVALRIDVAVPPRRVRWATGARAVLELRAGEAQRLGLRAGSRLTWRVTSMEPGWHHFPDDSIIRTLEGEIR